MENITETVTGAATATATTDIRPEDTATRDVAAGQDTAGAKQKTADSGGGAEKTYDQAYIDRLMRLPWFMEQTLDDSHTIDFLYSVANFCSNIYNHAYEFYKRE